MRDRLLTRPSTSRGTARAAAPRERSTLLLGSHLDTVRDAGRFDGALGVLLPWGVTMSWGV